MFLPRHGDGVAIAFVRTFDCRVIFIDEVALDELDCEARLAHTSSTDDDELVFPEELMQGPVSDWKGQGRLTTNARQAGMHGTRRRERTLEAILLKRRRTQDGKETIETYQRLFGRAFFMLVKKVTSICGGDGTRRDPGRSDRCQGKGRGDRD